MEVETTVQVNASASQLWQAVTDVEHWSEWTPTINEVTWLTEAGPPGPLRPGGRARIRQPGLPELVWQVSDVLPGSSFSWRASTRGVTMDGTHQVRPLDAGRSQLTLRLSVTGPLAPVVGLFTRRRATRSLQHEADGMKRCAEVAASAPG